MNEKTKDAKGEKEDMQNTKPISEKKSAQLKCRASFEAGGPLCGSVWSLNRRYRCGSCGRWISNYEVALAAERQGKKA